MCARAPAAAARLRAEVAGWRPRAVGWLLSPPQSSPVLAAVPGAPCDTGEGRGARRLQARCGMWRLPCTVHTHWGGGGRAWHSVGAQSCATHNSRAAGSAPMRSDCATGSSPCSMTGFGFLHAHFTPSRLHHKFIAASPSFSAGHGRIGLCRLACLVACMTSLLTMTTTIIIEYPNYTRCSCVWRDVASGM